MCAVVSLVQEWEESTDSPSYPGLTTMYRLHQVDATVHGLPTNGFASAKCKTRYHWDWRQDAPGGLVRTAEMLIPAVE